MAKPPTPIDEFDRSDEPTAVDKRTQAEIDHVAIHELTKRVTSVEANVERLVALIMQWIEKRHS